MVATTSSSKWCLLVVVTALHWLAGSGEGFVGHAASGRWLPNHRWRQTRLGNELIARPARGPCIRGAYGICAADLTEDEVEASSFAWGPQLSRLLSAAVAVALVWLVASVPAQAAQKLTEQVTGFADFAKKGGAMDVKPECFITSCGKQTKECFVEDSRCLKGALCLSRCRGDPDCATQCFAEFGGKRLDAWLNCTVEREKCVSTPDSLISVDQWFESNIPRKAPNFNSDSILGKWYKVRGYNAKYDCYLCQPNTFERGASSNLLAADIRLSVPKLKSGGAWENVVKEDLIISKESDRSTFSVTGEIFGLSFTEEWYVLAGDDDYKLVSYKGKNLQDVYEGAFIYTRTPELPASVEAKARAAAEAAGYAWSKFCVVDNACPVQAPVSEGAATLGWDDIPDLVEWFAPGTIAKNRDFTGAYD